MHFPGIETGVYRARAVIVGASFDADEPIEFDHVEIRTSALETWLGLTPLTLKLDTNGGGTVTFTRLQPIEFPLAGGEVATLRFTMSFGGFGVGITKAATEYAPWFGLRFGELRPLEEVTSAVGWLRNFLSLAAGKPLSVLAIDAYRDDFVGQHDEPVTMHLYYPLAHNPEPSERRVNQWELLFDFPQVRDRLSDVLTRWLAIQGAYEPVLGLFFGTLYQQSSFREQRFLQYAQAIETYDRLKRPTAKVRGKQEHKGLIGEIVEAVPGKHRKWLKSELAWSNDLKLAHRIEHVLGGCPNVTARIVGDEGVDAFVKAAKWTRNYYTHYDPHGKEKAATDARDMHRLTVQLRAVLETALLLELGFDCDAIEAGLERARRFEEINIQR